MPPRRLDTRFDVRAWYRSIRTSGEPVAWCSAFAPAELLLACGATPVYPENHAAMLGALSPDRDPEHPYSRHALATAAADGHGFPRLCSYALADIGALIDDASSPIGGLPEPALFYACDSQCSVVERWGADVQRLFDRRGRRIEHYVLRAPPLRHGEQHPPAVVARFAAQMRDHAENICAELGTRFDVERLRAVVAESDAANHLWQRCLELAAQRPTPWSMTEAFGAMAPIVIARGTPACTAFYRELLAELETRCADGITAIADEGVRLLWDAIPIWPRRHWLGELAARHHALFVVSTYTHSWWFRFDPDDALRSLATRYSWNTMNRTGAWVRDWTLDLYRRFACDGIVCHWNHSCGIWNSYVKRRLPAYRAAGIPHLVIQADMVDAARFDAAHVERELGAFIDHLHHHAASGSVPSPGPA